MKRIYTILLATLSLTASSALLAYDNNGRVEGETHSKTIDFQYELGKSYYKTPQADGSRLEYCVNGDNGLLKLSRPSVRRFKHSPASYFVDSLYNCADPATKIAATVPREHSEAILYYLNKRYKLRLQTD